LDKDNFRSGRSGASLQRIKIMTISKKTKVAPADTMAPRTLTLEEIQAISGGLNPQPLPPVQGPKIFQLSSLFREQIFARQVMRFW